jgi:hypothetical protein
MSHEKDSAAKSDAFARRIASFLQDPVQLDSDFEARVMAAVEEEQGGRPSERAEAGRAQDARQLDTRRNTSRNWWLREHRMTFSPLAVTALAIGFAAIGSLTTAIATLGIHARGSDTLPPQRVTATSAEHRSATPERTAGPALSGDTVYIMRFAIAAGAAHSVSVVGDFNGWAKHATPLSPVGRHGVWVAEVPLPPGRYEYAFIVDGKQWIPDPLAIQRADDFDTHSSVVTLGS